MEGAGLAGEALDDDLGVLVDEDGHQLSRIFEPCRRGEAGAEYRIFMTECPV
jgi:hypothetical protein